MNLEIAKAELEVMIFTAPFEAYTYQRKLNPPGAFALYSPLMVLIPRHAFKGSLWEKILDLLPLEDWFIDGGQPCLVLGEAKMHPDGRYYPEEQYDIGSALHTTKEFRAPQKKMEKKEQENAEKRRQRDQFQQMRADQQRQAAESKRLEMERNAFKRQFDAQAEIQEMKDRLRQLEAEKNQQGDKNG